MTIDLDALESAAKAATPGPWETIGYRIYADKKNIASAQEVYSYREDEVVLPKEAEANATFIAAANPTTMLALIAELRETRAERDWLAKRIALDGVSCPIEPNVCAGTCADHIQCWLEAARDAVEKEAKK